MPVSAKSTTPVQEDREETSYSKNSTGDSDSYTKNTFSEPATTQVSQEEMINITSCDINQFGAYMSKQYGATQFTKGFQIVKSNQDLIYVDDGEEQLVKLLQHLFKNEDLIRGFMNFCTTFLIVQNMQYGS